MFRGGCCFTRGRGRIFYFSPGDQEYPVYHHPDVRRVLANAAAWAAPTDGTAARPTRPSHPPAGSSGDLHDDRRDAPLRGVVVGAGALGPHWGFELHHSGDVELAGWVDLVPERAAAAAAGFGARRRPSAPTPRRCSTRSRPTSSSTSARRPRTTRSRSAALERGVTS